MTDDRPTADEHEPTATDTPEAVTLTVIAYATGYQTLVRVSARAQAHTLVGQLGGPVGVSQVANLLLTDNTPIPPDTTLASMGVRDGGTVFVVGVYDTTPEPPAPTVDLRSTEERQDPAGSAAPAEAERASAPTDPLEESPTPTAASEHEPIPTDASATDSNAATSDPGNDEAATTHSATTHSAGEESGAAIQSVTTQPDAHFLPHTDTKRAPASATETVTSPDQDSDPDPAATDPAATDPAATDHAATTHAATTHAATDPAPDAAGRPLRPSRRLMAAAGATAVVLVVAAFAIGRATDSADSTTASKSTLAAARNAARIWLDARPYPAGEVATGASPGQGRVGKVEGALQLVGSSNSHGRSNVWFVLAPTSRAAVGLSMVLEGDRLTAAPTLSPLPFGGGRVPPPGGATPTPISKQTPAALTSWATTTFGPQGPLTGTLDLGLTGGPHVAGVSPVPGAGTVFDVRLNLASTASGTAGAAGAAALAKAQAAVRADQDAVAKTQQGVSRDRAGSTKDATAVNKDAGALANDANAVAQASTANDAAGQALGAVTAAANAANAANAAAAANPPPPPATPAPPTPVPDVGPDLAAAASAAQALAAAQTQQTADQSRQSTDQAAQGKDRTQLTADQAELDKDRATLHADQSTRAAVQAKLPPKRSAVGTYDVWVVGGRVRGWVPAGYTGS